MSLQHASGCCRGVPHPAVIFAPGHSSLWLQLCPPSHSNWQLLYHSSHM